MPKSDLDTLSSRLRFRVTLITLAAPEDQGSLGNPIEQPQVEADAWADVRAMSAREFAYAGTLVGTVTSVVEIRWRPGWEMDGRLKRVRFRERSLNVDGVTDPESLKVRLLLFCTEPR